MRTIFAEYNQQRNSIDGNLQMWVNAEDSLEI